MSELEKPSAPTKAEPLAPTVSALSLSPITSLCAHRVPCVLQGLYIIDSFSSKFPKGYCCRASCNLNKNHWVGPVVTLIYRRDVSVESWKLGGWGWGGRGTQVSAPGISSPIAWLSTDWDKYKAVMLWARTHTVTVTSVRNILSIGNVVMQQVTVALISESIWGLAWVV